MPTVIATPGATTANSYATKAQASVIGGYFETKLFTTSWTGASVSDRNTALIWATRLLDDWVSWIGTKVDENQSLRWPRYEVKDEDGYYVDSDAIPVFLREATSELAGYLLAGDPTAEPDTKGYKRLKVDVLELEVDKHDRDSATTIPDSVKSMVAHYGQVRNRGGFTTAALQRS